MAKRVLGMPHGCTVPPWYSLLSIVLSFCAKIG
jgi:hypothetical protein